MTTYQSYSTIFNEQLGGTDEQIMVTIEYGEDFTGDGYDDIRVTLKLADGSSATHPFQHVACCFICVGYKWMIPFHLVQFVAISIMLPHTNVWE